MIFSAIKRAARLNVPPELKKLLLIMKLTTLLLIIAILQVSATTYAQKFTFHKNGASLQEVFKEITRQTAYNVFYSDENIDVKKKIDVDFSNADIKDVLDKLSASQNLEYTIDAKNISVKEKDPSFLDNLKNKLKAELAQTTVTGQVVDGTGQPMAGVTVREKSNGNGTETDAKGNFRLTVASDNSLITFSYIGYESQEIQAKYIPNSSVITLKPAENNLQEVVINKGYYNEKQELSTGDVSIVTAKEIEEQPVSDPILALEARVPGLNIQQTSGMPGAYSTIRIRGQNSIANGNDPLYIIDGVPFSSGTLTSTAIGGGALGVPSSNSVNAGTASVQWGQGMSPFNALNPDDIESIEVLKDADATAIYGSRGANGVILITTKKGKPGNTRVSLDLSQGIGQVTRMMDLLNTQQYLQIRHQAYKNDAITTIPANAYDLNGAWDTTRNTNWQKALIGNTAHYTNAQVSVSGGTENTQFYLGAGFNRQTTVYPGDYYDAKGSLNFNLTHSSADKRFQLTFLGGYVNDVNKLPQTDLTSTALSLAPDAPTLYNANGSLNWQPVGGSATWENPLAYTLQSAAAIVNNLVSNLQLSYRILPGLQLKASAGYNNDQMSQTLQSPASSQPPPYNTMASERANNFANTISQTWIIEPQLTYDRNIAKGKLSLLAGTSFQQSTFKSIGYYSSGFNSDALIPNAANASSLFLVGDNNSLYRYNAVYARLNYTWDDKYLLNLTARRDGSSRFGPEKQWGNFGAVGAGWIFTKEKFAKDNLSWLSFGKLRGSYGITGNDQIGDYKYLSSYSTNSPTYEGTTGLYPTIIPNSNYGWEIDKKLEGGLELGLLKGRINLSADYYRDRTANQLVPYALPEITGFSSVLENLPAVVQNTGVEFVLNTINVRTNDFTWSTSVNLTIPKNKLISYPGIATSSYARSYVVGQSLFIKEGYKVAGVNPQTGVYEYYNASGQITASPAYGTDFYPTQPVTQQYYGGFQNSFSYKGFQLDILFQFVKQFEPNYFYQETEEEIGLVNRNWPTVILNASQTPGNISPYGLYSTKRAADPNGGLSSSTLNFGDASYIRLKNLALSYSLPKSWVQQAHFQNARIYIQGQNMLTFTHYLGIDPETGPSGLPSLRMITAGISASL